MFVFDGAATFAFVSVADEGLPAPPVEAVEELPTEEEEEDAEESVSDEECAAGTGTDKDGCGTSTGVAFTRRRDLAAAANGSILSTG